MESTPLVKKIANVLLRVVSLAAKLALSLYMGRYLGLSDLGVYGLVFSVVTISTIVLGLRVDYVVVRDLVDCNPLEAMRKMRDQTLFYGLNYVVFALFGLVLVLFHAVSFKLACVIFMIAVLENLTNIFTTNLVSLGRPILATGLFFVRSGLWSLFVVGLGLTFPAFRSVQAILVAWALGEAVSLVWTLWVFRRYPWREALRFPVDRVWLTQAIYKSLPFWLSSLGATVAGSVDRFVVSHYLGLESVGVITFYGSFSAALLSLVHSGFYSFSYPRLIAHYREGQISAFWKETRYMVVEVALFVTLASVVLGVGIPYSAQFFGKPAFATEAVTLWLMLLSVLILSLTQALYYVLYARHQDTSLWMGGLLILIPAVLGNFFFVPIMGLVGVGYSAVLSSSLLLVWWLFFVFWGPRKKTCESKAAAESNSSKMAEFLDP
ncbi:MAG: hypothetical protein WC612_00900 [Bdellovibrionales bacterium]|jgi:O-antigen/teichoic acid export membrane protein